MQFQNFMVNPLKIREVVRTIYIVWDIDLKGKTTKKEKELLNLILTERRKKKWAAEYGIDWMDGMPLTKEMIATFLYWL